MQASWRSSECRSWRNRGKREKRRRKGKEGEEEGEEGKEEKGRVNLNLVPTHITIPPLPK